MQESNRDQTQLQIEKQKTIRLFMIVSVTLVLAVSSMYLLLGRESGEVDIDVTRGKFSLTMGKPILDQIDISTSDISFADQTINFTEGKINNPDIISELNSLNAPPDQFSGENFINQEVGFLLSVPRPENWQVGYNPAGLYNANIPVNTIYNSEGSHLNIGVSPILPGMSIQQYVDQNIQMMLQNGMIQQMPEVSYDLPSQTAFAVFTNPYTMGQSYQKVIIDRDKGRVFVASANYNQGLSSPTAIQDLITMVTTFTLIGR